MTEREWRGLFKLAGLKFEERGSLRADLEEALRHFKKIQSVQTDGIVPMASPLSSSLPLREDSPQSFSNREALLGLSPQRRGGWIQTAPTREEEDQKAGS